MQGIPQRSFTLGKLKSTFGVQSTDQIQEQSVVDAAAQGLYSVCLSDGIRSIDALSPGLYNFLLSGDFRPKSALRFFSPSGEAIFELPKHLTQERLQLTQSSSEEMLFNVNPVTRVAAEQMRKQTRYRPVRLMKKKETNPYSPSK